MNTPAVNRRHMRGLTLVETMVAITISLILMGGAITLFINNKVTYQVNDNMSRLQENARFAINFMIQDLQMASYFGCNNSSEKVVNNFAPGAGELGATDDPLEGFDNGGNWSPSNEGGPADIVAATDGFTVRHLTGDSQVVVGGDINSLTLDDATDFAAGEQVAVFDCGGTDIFEIDTLVGDVITGTLSREYDTNGDVDDPSNPRVTDFVAIRYFIGNGTNGPSLFREVLRAGVIQLEELIEGVENMQIVYGVDTSGDNIPNTYVPAGNAALNTGPAWESVIAVRIAMLVRTLEEYGQDVDAQTYQLNDITVNAANDRFKRRVFNTTVLLRNRLT